MDSANNVKTEGNVAADSEVECTCEEMTSWYPNIPAQRVVDPLGSDDDEDSDEYLVEEVEEGYESPEEDTIPDMVYALDGGSMHSLYIPFPGASTAAVPSASLPMAVDVSGDESERLVRDRSPLSATGAASPEGPHFDVYRSQGETRSASVSPSPSYSPLSSPRSREDREQNARDVARGACPAVPRTRRRIGGSRGAAAAGRGRGVRRGRVSRAADSGVIGYSEWRRGDQVLEVCKDDEDIPAPLKKMVEDIENARCMTDMRTRRRESSRNVRTDSDDESDDEFQDARSREEVQKLFGGDRGAVEFSWSPMATFSGQAEEFQPKNPGPTVTVSGPYEAFRVYWDDSILKHIVRETNRYAVELKASSARFARDWYDTNVHEIMILFSFWMMLGVIRMPSIKSCFSTNPLLKTDVFRRMMTEARYWLLNRALYFVNNDTRTSDSSKLFSLGPIHDHLNLKFKEAYVLRQKISIDESLTLWKGNLSFRQYIQTKAARFGIKTFELCESATGYLWSFVIYTGKETSDPQSRMLKSTEIVVRLMSPLLNKGHQLFMDNWFNSPVLARYLKRNKTDCIGTLRKTRKHLPALVQVVKIPEGTCVARHAGDVAVMVYMDKKPVYTISTCHGTESVQVAKPGSPEHYKLAIIADYNVSMGGVDKKDQMLEPYLIERKKNRKWYKKIFKRLLNVSINNSRILLQESGSSSYAHQAYRTLLVDEILRHHLHLVPQPRVRQAPSRVSEFPPERLVDVGSHFIERIPVPELTNLATRTSIGRQACIYCKLTTGKRKKTVYWCDNCHAPLCLESCFKAYHTP